MSMQQKLNNFNHIAATIKRDLLLKKIDSKDKKEILDFYISTLRDGEFDFSPYLNKDFEGMSLDALRWNVILYLKSKLGYREVCHYCYSDDFEIIDWIERATLPDAVACKCNNCGERWGYNLS